MYIMYRLGVVALVLVLGARVALADAAATSTAAAAATETAVANAAATATAAAVATRTAAANQTATAVAKKTSTAAAKKTATQIVVGTAAAAATPSPRPGGESASHVSVLELDNLTTHHQCPLPVGPGKPHRCDIYIMHWQLWMVCSDDCIRRQVTGVAPTPGPTWTP